MPKPRQLLNGFTAREVAAISGLSLHMVNYLAREAYLTPAYPGKGTRGTVRYYSYRDLVVAKLVQHLREAGIELKRLKEAISELSRSHWHTKDKKGALGFVATDGHKLFFPDSDGALTELTSDGQRAFAFVLDLQMAEKDVKSHLKGRRLLLFSLENKPLRPEARSA
ncbi:MerR family transcriptional regulator [Mesorhizobium sp. B2-3-11]|uniref:MerR family transcriptional regulator n=1 Tax=Mesorhizobium sp. B2-3-11 TaxID=2589953 RepID=UPI00112EF25A|nr:MerR family transcriptional regulator [Mesorhizobium sp. B2-3-11]TPL96421.1 MerR family transcriptional regulator [Mesorhizobium sp. B2-3-11]